MPTLKSILQANQPEIYKQITKRAKKRKKKKSPRMSTREVEGLMRHSAYVRSRGGAIKQVRHRS